MRTIAAALIVILLGAPGASGGNPARVYAAAPPPEGKGLIHRVVAWIPSRVADALDIVRVRARLGPGLAVGARATDALDGYAGAYSAVWAGLPGPRGRGRSLPRLPIGLEARLEDGASPVDETITDGLDPGYGSIEIGGGLQLFLGGGELGIDPLEVTDFVAGIFFIDLMDDDF